MVPYILIIYELYHKKVLQKPVLKLNEIFAGMASYRNLNRYVSHIESWKPFMGLGLTLTPQYLVTQEYLPLLQVSNKYFRYVQA